MTLASKWTTRAAMKETQKARRDRERRQRPALQPLHEALAIGLGSESFQHRMRPAPEWMR